MLSPLPPRTTASRPMMIPRAVSRRCAVTVTGCPMRDRGRRLRDGEPQHGGLLLERAAPSLKAELQGDVRWTNGRCVLEGRRIAVAIVVGFDPKRIRID